MVFNDKIYIKQCVFFLYRNGIAHQNASVVRSNTSVLWVFPAIFICWMIRSHFHSDDRACWILCYSVCWNRTTAQLEIWPISWDVGQHRRTLETNQITPDFVLFQMKNGSLLANVHSQLNNKTIMQINLLRSCSHSKSHIRNHSHCISSFASQMKRKSNRFIGIAIVSNKLQ